MVLRAESCTAAGRWSQSASKRGLSRRSSSISARSGSSAGKRAAAAWRSATMPASNRACSSGVRTIAPGRAEELAARRVAAARRRAAPRRAVLGDDLPRRVADEDRQVPEPLDHPLHAGRQLAVDAPAGRGVAGEPEQRLLLLGREPQRAGQRVAAPAATGSWRGPARAGSGSRPTGPRAARPPRAAGRARGAADPARPG